MNLRLFGRTQSVAVFPLVLLLVAALCLGELAAQSKLGRAGQPGLAQNNDKPSVFSPRRTITNIVDPLAPPKADKSPSETASEKALKSIVDSTGSSVSVLESSYDQLFDQASFDEIEIPGRPLRQIGYDLFDNGPDELPTDAALQPARDFDSGFALAPGDALLVATYGSTSLELESKVDTKMQVFFPKIGVLSLLDLSYADAEKLIRERFEAYYLGTKVYVQLQTKTNRSVHVIGKVRKPGIKLIDARTSLFDAILAAGGITRLGSLRNIEVRKGGKVTRVDLYDMVLTGRYEPTLLGGGETIFVPPLRHTVAIIGEVLVPGIYELRDDSNIDNLLQMAQGLTPLGSARTVSIFRPSSSNNNIDTVSVSQEQAATTPLRNFDILRVLSRRHLVGNSLFIKGDVNYPGTYEYIPGETLYQALQRAGGTIDGKVVFLRRRLETSKKIALPNSQHGELHHETMEFPLDRTILESMLLQPGDMIEVPRQDPMTVKSSVQIFGAVLRPGEFDYMQDMNTFSLLHRAGGATRQADLERLAVSRIREGRVDLLQLAGSGNLMQDMQALVLEPGDVVNIPVASANQVVVQATGEFIQPGTYMLKKGARLTDLITAAGGLKNSAYTPGAAFFRSSVARVYDEQLQKLAQRLEADLLRSQNSNIQASLESQQEKNAQVFGRQERLINSLYRAKSPGRVVIQIPRDWRALKGTSDDIILEADDRLEMPTEPSTVNIIGQVNNPNTVVFSSQLKLGDYLDAAGGFTKYADQNNVFVIRINGAVVPAGKIQTGQRGWLAGRGKESFRQRIEPGDTVFIPEDFEIKPNKLQLTKDITQIMFQIMTSVGVAVALF